MAVDSTPGAPPVPQPQTQDPDAFQTTIYIAHIPWVCHLLFSLSLLCERITFFLSFTLTRTQWTSEQEVQEAVEKFGEVKSCVIGECRSNGKSRGFAKVTFAHPGCACVAKKELDGSTSVFADAEKPLLVAYPKSTVSMPAPGMPTAPGMPMPAPGAPVVPPAAMAAMNKMFMNQMPPMPGMQMPPMNMPMPPMGMQMPPMGMPMPGMNMVVPGAPAPAPSGDGGASLLPFPGNR